MKNKVSIIVPYYNVQKEYLEICMNSLLKQTYKNIEIIVVDDGSKEEFSRLLDDYANMDNVKLIYKKNGGVSTARNMGMARATGDWCMFVDPDDWLEKDGVKNFIELIQNDNLQPDYIISKTNINRDNRVSQNINQISQSQFVDKNMVIKDIIVNHHPNLTCIDTVWAKLYNVDFLRSNDLMFDPNLLSGEDVSFSLECALNANNIYYLDKTTYNYRYNVFSECRTCKNLDVKSTAMLNSIKNILDKHNLQNTGYYDYYVLRVISRLLRKQYSFYEYENEFFNDLKKLLSLPEYNKVISHPNEKYFEDSKSTLAQMCKNEMYSEILNLIQEGQIQK